jgi:Fe-S cluster biosynthesis and repair protein YggX
VVASGSSKQLITKELPYIFRCLAAGTWLQPWFPLELDFSSYLLVWENRLSGTFCGKNIFCWEAIVAFVASHPHPWPSAPICGKACGFMVLYNIPMPRMVKCVKLGRELPGLNEPPFDTELGQKIYENVSAEAWKMWAEHSKMLLNEYRLQPWKPEAQQFLVEQMQQYFFGSGAQLPKEFVPPPK